MKYGLSLIVLILIACNEEYKTPLETVLASKHHAILKVVENLETHEVQIIFTQIERSQNSVCFKDYEFQVDSKNYFYPASTVKLPAAVLALEYLYKQKNIDVHTPYTTPRDTLTHTVADDIRQIFAVSDNEAYNRLYELLGRDYMYTRLHEKGITPVVRIAHRLSTVNASIPKRVPTYFKNDTIQIKPDTPLQANKINHLKKGKGYIENGSLVIQPMDFSMKNHFPLQAQHKILKRIFFPEVYTASQRFTLSDSDRNLLLETMHTVPRHQGYPTEIYYDSYGKFFMYGDTQDSIPEHIHIYNKVGYAYGTLTDTAYIVDEENDIEFLLSATILVNKNGVFNDDIYEYDEVGIPFLAQLGRELYAFEKAKN